MSKKLTTAGAIIISISLLAPSAKAAASRVEVPTIPTNVAVVRQVEQPQQMFVFKEKNGEVEVSSALKFSDVPVGHWAYRDVLTGVQKGYVDGFTDGTFAPDKPVSRAEFIKMVVAATRLPVGQSKVGEPWYLPYTTAARQYGFIGDQEYENDNFTAPMTRLEMAKVAVRAAKLNAEYDEQFMLVATENGLVMGVGSGNLQPFGTTTRAQSVTIVERVLKVREGEKLPVDDKAIENAKEYAKREFDPWGREIRTENLPKNADDFPYILKDLPNEFYELRIKDINSPFKNSRTAKELAQMFDVSKEQKQYVASTAEDYYNHILNVDYRTIDYVWAEKIVDLVHYSGMKENLLETGMEYVDWVKDNEVIIEGSFVAEPSSLYASGLGILTVRGVLEFNIKNIKEGVDTSRSPIVNQSNRYSSKFYEKKGIRRKIVTDIEINGPLRENYKQSYPVMTDVFYNYVELD